MPHNPRNDHPSLVEFVEEVSTLGVGVGVVLLPAMILSIPGLVLFVALPAILIGAVLAVPLALAALLAGPPWLVVRLLRRHARARRLVPST